MVRSANYAGKLRLPTKGFPVMRPVWHRSGIITLFFVVVTSGMFAIYTSSEESRRSLVASDQAFDTGDLKRSQLEARFCAMAAIQRSELLRKSLERLSAIAVGSESAGRSKTALLARMSLFSVLQSRGEKVDQSYGLQSDEQLRFLIDRVSPSTLVDGGHLAVSGRALAPASYPGAVAVSLLLIAIAAVLFGWEIVARRLPLRFALWMVPILTVSAWFAGWFIV